MKLSNRLKSCLTAGGVIALFSMLKDWPETDLRALLKDIAELYEKGSKAVDRKFVEEAFKPENFLSKSNSKTLDQARNDAYLEVLGTCSEIASVALYYLREKG